MGEQTWIAQSGERISTPEQEAVRLNAGKMIKIDKDCYSREHGEKEIASMNVSLTPELEKFVADKVESGRYNSASEVVREALRLLEEHDRARSVQLAAFSQEIGARLAALDRGERIEPDAARERLQRKSQERRKLSA
jgi:antitoxin ParD1/3/4